MSIKTFIEYNFAPIVGLLFQLIILILDNNFSKKDKKLFYLAVILETLELITYNIEFYYSELGTYHYARTIFSVLGYIIRPLLAYPFVMLIRNSRKNVSKWVYLDLVPYLICFVIQLIALNPDNKLVFSISETNHFHRGPLGYVSHALIIFYLAEVILQVVLSRNSKESLNPCLLILIFVYCSLSMIFESNYSIRSLGESACIFSVVFFMLALETNHLNNMTEELKIMSEIDSLSQLNNRYYGEKQINEKLSNKASGILAILDIDKFKEINDTYGHSIGDEAIIKVAKALKDTKANDDVIMRLGGDEFAIYSINMDSNTIMEHIEKIFDEMNKIELSINKDYRINVSIGLCEYSGLDIATFDDLYKKADAKLYQSKTHEGNYASI